LDDNEYFIIGDLPVKFVATPDGGLEVLKMSWTSGRFESGMEFYARAGSSSPDVEQVSEDEFIQQVEGLRGRRVRVEGSLAALYELINATEDIAEEEGRALSPEEQALLAQLRRQTYELFQAEYPDPDLE
jgi:hypothetical protein